MFGALAGYRDMVNACKRLRSRVSGDRYYTIGNLTLARCFLYENIGTSIPHRAATPMLTLPLQVHTDGAWHDAATLRVQWPARGRRTVGLPVPQAKPLAFDTVPTQLSRWGLLS